MDGKNNKLERLTLFLLGNSAVGKTSFINKYVNDIFSEYYLTTIGIDFVIKTIKLPTGEDITLRFYDTAGQESYKAISYNLIKNADGIFLLYDITNRKSFDEINDWIDNIKDNKGDDFPVILIGNKCDKNDKRNIDEKEGQKLAEKKGFLFMETSCKKGINIEESVNLLVIKIIEKKKLERLKEIEEGKNGDDQNVNRIKPFKLAKDKKQGQKKKKKWC